MALNFALKKEGAWEKDYAMPLALPWEVLAAAE